MNETMTTHANIFFQYLRTKARNMNGFTLTGILIMAGLITNSCSLFGHRSYEMPKYKTLVKEDNKEIRQYDAYIVARTNVASKDYSEAQSIAFRRLAGYIFGSNQMKKNIAMTAPVIQESRKNVNIPMTAPVTQESTPTGWSMSFMMPRSFTLETLPAPIDERVTFEEIPPKLIASIQYSWFRTEARNAEYAETLISWLRSKSDEYEVVSQPSYAGYDPPWTIPFLKRNEILIEIAAK